MLNGNKFGKYLLYAIGEIMLVVIGILIAVQIDEHYTQKENQNQINILINEIESQIEADIQGLREVQQLYEESDSLINLFKSGNVTVGMIDSNARFRDLTTRTEQYDINKQPFFNLDKLNAFIPENQRELKKQIDLLYTQRIVEIEKYNAFIYELAMDNVSKKLPQRRLLKTKEERNEWYVNSDIHTDQVEYFKFMLHNYFYVQNKYYSNALKILALMGNPIYTSLNDQFSLNCVRVKIHPSKPVLQDQEASEKKSIRVVVFNKLTEPISLMYKNKNTGEMAYSRLNINKMIRSQELVFGRVLVTNGRYEIRNLSGETLGQFYIESNNSYVEISGL